jgi:hypothetical protein
MGRAWRWPEARVRRFLECLKTDAMIDAATDAGRTIVSICNYDRYQWSAGDTDAAIDAPSDARSTQHRRKLEECNNDLKKEGPPSAALSPSKPKPSRALAPRDYTPAFETFWAGYPKTKTSNPKAVAFDVFEKLNAADRDTATASLPAFRDWVSGQFKGYQAPGASVYLRQRRFDDLAPVTNGSRADPEKVLAGQRIMARLFFSGEWHPNWGAPPGEPGCTIPDDLIAEVANASGALWPTHLRAQA